MRVARLLPVLVVAAVALVWLAAAQPPSVPYSYQIEGCLNIVTVNGSLVPVPPGLTVVIMYNGSVVNITETKYVDNNNTGVHCWGYSTYFQNSTKFDYLDVYVESVYAGRTTNDTWTEFPPGSGYYYIRADFNLSDTEPPTAPTGLRVLTPINDTTPAFAWNTSSDNLAVRGYYVAIVRNGSIVVSDFTNETNWTSSTSLSDGVYVFSVKATDYAGLNSTASNLTFYIDTTPPSAAVLSPANGSILNTGDVTVEALACDEVNVSSYTLTVDGSAVPASASAYNSTCLLVTANVTGLGDGWHNATITVVDGTGASASDTSVFLVDTTAPSITVVSPVNGSIVGSSDVSFTVNVSDALSGVNTSSLTVTVDGSPATPAGLTVNVSDGVAVFSFQLNLTSGWHTVAVNVSDNAGNTGSASVVVGVDLSAPVVTGVAPANGSLLGAAEAQPATLLVNASDDLALGYAVFIVDGSVAGNVSFGGAATGSASIQYNFTVGGTHNVTVYVYDMYGRNGSASWSFYVDLSAPVLVSTAPINGTIVGSPSFTVNVIVADDYALNASGFNVLVDGSPYANYTVVELNSTTVNVSISLSGLGDGWHNVSVEAYDVAGNAARFNLVYGVDTVPPSITVVEPVNGSVTAGAVSVNATIVDGFSGVNASSIEVLVDGEPVNYSLTPVAGGYIVYVGGLSLADGAHNVTVSACDAVGNCANVTVVVTVDTAPPSITVESPEPINYTVADVPITGFACDPNGVSSFYAVVDGSLRIDGVAYNETCMIVNQTVTLDMGSHNVSFTAVDVVGNTATETVAFNVLTDVVPPTVEPVAPVPGGYAAGPDVSIEAVACDSGSGINASATVFTVDGSPVAVSAAPINVSCTLLYATVTLDEGLHTASVTVYDNAGNNASTSWSFTVDSTPPSLAVESPANGSWYNTITVPVYVVAADNYMVTALSLALNGTPVNASVVGLGTGSASANATLSLADGWYELTAAASDEVNFTAMVAVFFGVDTVPPSVAVTSPANGSLLGNSTVTITANVGDSMSGVASVEVLVDGVPVGFNWSDGTVSAVVTLADGPHTATVVACDAAGNCASATAVFTVDTTPPVIGFDASNGTVFYKDVVWINGSVTEIHMAGVPVINDTRFTLAYWDPATGRFAFRNTTSLEDGNYTVEVSYTDAVNNTGRAVLMFSYVNAEHLNITVYSGWNLVGVSLEPVDPSTRAVFEELLAKYGSVVIYYWNATSRQWLVWNPLLPTPTLRELHAGMAVYVYVSGENVSVSFRMWGLPANATYRLAVGWNMIAVTEPVSPSEFLPSVDWSMVLDYDPVTGTSRYYIRGLGGTLDQLVPGRGYWLKVNSLPPE